MTEHGGREGEPAAKQAQRNAERAARDEAADPEERHEGEPAAEQAREET